MKRIIFDCDSTVGLPGKPMDDVLALLYLLGNPHSCEVLGITCTFANGTEYTVLATALGMGKALLRLLQAFDFTRKSPKLVAVDAKEGGACLQDAILLTLLNLLGFDVALFVPTGYRTVERYLADNLPVEHQIGDYIYDLTPPELDAMPQPRPAGLFDRLFRREK